MRARKVVIQEATIIGLFVLVIGAGIKELFGWVSKKNIQNSEARLDSMIKNIDLTNQKIDSVSSKIEDLIKQSQDMYDWHNKSDADGVKIWYVRQSLENALRDNAKATEAIARNIELQTRLLEEMIANQRNLSKEQAEMMKDIRDIERALDEK